MASVEAAGVAAGSVDLAEVLLEGEARAVAGKLAEHTGDAL